MIVLKTILQLAGSLIKKLFLFAFLLESIYIVATFTFLNTPLFHKIVSLDPKEFSIDFSMGWTIIPGDVHLKNVKVAGQDPNVHWLIDLPALDTHIQLLDLIKKEVHLLKVKGPQVSFSLRMKSPEEQKLAKQQDEGGDVSLEEKKKHWKLIFDDILLESVGKLQVGKYYYTGNASIYGSFKLWPGVEAEIGPGFLDIKSGQFAALNESKAVDFLQNIKALFEVKFDRFDIANVKGSEVFDYFNLKANLVGKLSGSKLVDYYFRKLPGLNFGDEFGNISGDLQVAKGEIKSGHYEILPSQFEVFSRRFKISGNGKLIGDIYSVKNRSTSQLNISLSHIKLFAFPSMTHLADGNELSLLAETEDLKLRSLFTNMRVHLRLPQAQIPDVSKWNSIFKVAPYELKLKGGKGSLQVDLYGETTPSFRSKRQTKENNRVKFSFHDVDGKMKGAEFKAQISGDVKLNRIDLSRNHAILEQGDIFLKSVDWKFTSPHGESKTQGWWFFTHFSSGKFDFGPKPEVWTQVVIQTKSSEPVLNFLRQENEVSGLKYQLLNIDLIHAYADIKMNAQGVQVHDIDLKSNSLGVMGHLSLLNQGTFGALKGKLGVLSVGIGFDGKDTQIKLFPSDEFIKENKSIPVKVD